MYRYVDQFTVALDKNPLLLLEESVEDTSYEDEDVVDVVEYVEEVDNNVVQQKLSRSALLAL